MPVKNKRNASSRKNRTDPNTIAYSSSVSSQFSDPSVSSAASSPPEPVPSFSFSTRPSHLRSEPDAVRETVTDDIDNSDVTVGLTQEAVTKADEGPLYLESFTRQTEALQDAVPGIEEVSQRDDLHRAQAGHTRSPVLRREPTTLESLSRTLRGYMPSSISVPSAVPTPPRLSKPLSFGSFLTPIRPDPVSAHQTGSNAESIDTEYRAGGAVPNRPGPVSWREQRSPVDSLEEAVFNLDEDVHHGEGSLPPRPVSNTYPGATNDEEIVSATFGELAEGDGVRRLLFLGYRHGLQAWDCTNLGTVTEVLNLSGPSWGSVESISVLPNPTGDEGEDSYRSQRPLLGIKSAADQKAFIVYSLRSHAIVKTFQFPSITNFSASRDFIALSTADPPAIHIIASRTLLTVYTFNATLLSPLYHPINHPDSPEPVSLSVDHGCDTVGLSYNATIPTPVFALSHRLLAFASATPHLTSPIQASARTPLASHAAFDEASIKFPVSQTELGLTALRLGSSLFTGMKAIGGRAYSAARAGVSAAMAVDHGDGGPVVPVPGKFVSRSAPEASSHGEARRYSIASDAGNLNGTMPGDAQPEAATSSHHDGPTRKDRGHYITVVDLQPLRSGQSSPSSPLLVAEYMVSHHQPISRIEFSPDGTSIVVALQDGLIMKVYRLRPSSRASPNRGPSYDGSQDERPPAVGSHDKFDGFVTRPPWHVYDLRRGRTSAVVEQLIWAHDGRWLAVGTRKRTIHVFAPNPYGGPTHETSHFEGKVMNVSEAQPLSTELAPLVRLRLQYSNDSRALPASAFTFLHYHDDLPPALEILSPAMPIHHPSSPPSSQSLNPLGKHQDILIFDPRDGMLSLNRVKISKRRRGDISSTTRTVPIGNASISLPGVSSVGRLTGSLSNSMRQPSALTRMMEKSELVGDPSVVATWALRRSDEWPEIKQPFRSRTVLRISSRQLNADWLAHAELSTCSRSRKVVPKSIYLAHQFSFHHLGDDYHALLRSHRFDVPGRRIDVRRQVAVSASSQGMSESFVSGSSAPSQGAAFSSSFDEPLASALSADLGYANPSPPILPMYPNGPISTRSSGRSAIPIRMAAGISDNMSEGIGRLKREIVKVKTKPASRGVSRSVPLEFDEEDEDFLGLDLPSNAPSQSTSHGQVTSSTPSTDLDPLPGNFEDDDTWQGWDAQDKQAVDEVEQYDDIGVGFMDEEWMKSPH